MFDNATEICIRNGGSVRQAIGFVLAVNNETVYLPTQANPLANKTEGQVSQLDINSVLKFNNGLSILSVNLTSLVALLEHGLATTAWAGSDPVAFPGAFPLVSGNIRLSYNTSGVSYARIENLVITDGPDSDVIKYVVMKNGVFVGDNNVTLRLVTADYTANGGDNYPFMSLTLPGTRVELSAMGNGTSEQEALATFLTEFHGSNVTAYNVTDTPVCEDRRIVNLVVCNGTDSVLGLMEGNGMDFSVYLEFGDFMAVVVVLMGVGCSGAAFYSEEGRHEAAFPQELAFSYFLIALYSALKLLNCGSPREKFVQ